VNDGQVSNFAEFLSDIAPPIGEIFYNQNSDNRLIADNSLLFRVHVHRDALVVMDIRPAVKHPMRERMCRCPEASYRLPSRNHGEQMHSKEGRAERCSESVR
jgi:hypothetical protein